MKIGVLLSGCGVFDGSEIQEAVSVLIALDELGVEAQCLAPDMAQHHVMNHLKGEEMEPSRNVLVESARIARGEILSLEAESAEDLDGLVIPGGFGAAKNLCTWAFDGPDASVQPAVAKLIVDLVKAGKPIAALCVAPVAVAKALQGSGISATMTLGTTEGSSPYDISGFHGGLEATGMKTRNCPLGEIAVDEANKIISSPCYMMEASPAKILAGVRKACAKLVELAKVG
ncbi:MAG: isoprenoid biosynthesis glyoxalase ElbB [Verrucomicrobia bacterium]|nr:isoprenoid biosynthesis glyoxalase ElbB [Verrucomicrobiota bacterium]MCH8511487.1 isoprenoid biosynthesis glyoxalase ElbB [Kiritimatiellia bacterium]